MPNDKQPPQLVLPPEKKFKLPKGCSALKTKHLAIRYVTHMDLPALAFNALTATFLFCMMFFIISFKTHNPVARVGLPLCVIWTVAFYARKRLGTSVFGLGAKFYMDYVLGQLTVYYKGFHFTTWCSGDQGNDIDFQKHEIINADGKEGHDPKIEATSQDGYQVLGNVTIIYNLRGEPEALDYSLRFKGAVEMRSAIKEWIESRWSDIAGCNSYETLLYYKAEVKGWMDNLLGGDNKISPLEKITGTTIKLIMGNFGLDTESQETFAAKARMGLMREEIEALSGKKGGVSPDRALEGAQIAMKLVKKTVSENVNTQIYKGIPPHVHTFAPGSPGVVVGER